MADAEYRPVGLRFVTYNVLNTHERYDRRRWTLQRTLRGFNATILGLQEVYVDEGQHKEIKANMGGGVALYSVNMKPPEGLALFVRKRKRFKVMRHNVLNIGSGCAAQRILLKISAGSYSAKVWIVNAHLWWANRDIRYGQMKAILKWMKEERPSQTVDAVFLMGDLNSTPRNEGVYKLLGEAGYNSIYLKAEGKEPDVTWPNGTQHKKMTQIPGSAPLTLDYIWVKQYKRRLVAIESVSIGGTEPDSDDESLYPSDHYAIIADIQIRCLPHSGSSSTESLLNGDEEHLSFSGSASSSDGGYNYSVDSADLPPEYSLGYEYNDSE